MTTIKVSLPVYTRDNWGNLQQNGEIEVSTNSDFDTLSEGYEKLKPQIAELLLQIQAENQIVLDLQQMQSDLRDRRKVLRSLNGKITRANEQFERLKSFLLLLGIDACNGSLHINQSVLRGLRAIEPVVVEPVIGEVFDDEGDEDDYRNYFSF